MIKINEITSGDLVDDILKEIEATFGMLPKLWTFYANNPALLKANWTKQKLIMNMGVLRPELKEAIALSTSLENSCQYCVDAHKIMLSSLGVDVELVENSAYIEAGFSEKEKVLLDFAKDVNNISYKISDELFNKILQKNCTNLEVLEVIGVVELYSGYNMFLNTLKIPGGSL